jgi:uncharacterized membrane protein
MNRRRADAAVGLLLGAVFVVGGALGWQAYQQQQAFGRMGSMMGTSMGAVHGTNPLWYVFGTLLVTAVVGGGYLVVRDDRTTAGAPDRSRGETASSVNPEPSEGPTRPEEETRSESAAQSESETRTEEGIDPESQPRARVLDLLPEDERRILEPVLSSPGLTQIELRDRSEFSKSKVSQTVSDLEKRGLLYREPQGRTYRIYPSDDLQGNQAQ